MLVLLAGLTLLAQASWAQSSEYKLKAAYLCRFMDYIDWPEEAFATPDSPLVIGILGPDPFGGALDEVAAGRTRKGHPLVIRRYASVSEMGNCQAVFISSADGSRLTSILRSLEGRKVLTVADMNDFLERGGMLQFFTESNKVRFRINLGAARACKLKISSRLLQLAEVVKEGPASP